MHAMTPSEVKAAREALRLDRRAFSRAIYCEQSACGKWESGTRLVTDVNANNIARLLAGEAPQRIEPQANGAGHAASIKPALAEAGAPGTAPRRAHRRAPISDDISPTPVSGRAVATIGLVVAAAFAGLC
jgi:hypothetical protein